MRIQGYGPEEIIERLEKIIQIYDTYLNKEKVSNILPSGYFTLSDAVFGRVMLLCQIGICPDDKAEIFFQNSLEKGQRLFSNFAHQHKSSWQSRDGIAKFAGAVFIPQLILSFSGLPELADEAIMLMLAINLGLGEENYCNRIAKMSSNDIFYDLKSLYGH